MIEGHDVLRHVMARPTCGKGNSVGERLLDLIPCLGNFYYVTQNRTSYASGSPLSEGHVVITTTARQISTATLLDLKPAHATHRVQALHGLTFALMHLAAMGIIAQVPNRMTATARSNWPEPTG